MKFNNYLFKGKLDMLASKLEQILNMEEKNV